MAWLLVAARCPLVADDRASAAGHTIFLEDGNDTTSGYTAGIDLKANQRLLGEAATLQIGSDVLAVGDSAKRPTLTDSAADVAPRRAGRSRAAPRPVPRPCPG